MEIEFYYMGERITGWEIFKIFLKKFIDPCYIRWSSETG